MELEHEREENARRAVFDERVRIARELHDVVAHHGVPEGVAHARPPLHVGAVMRPRGAVALAAFSSVAIAACADGATTTQSTAGTAPAVDLSHAAVAGDYAAASETILARGRDVVDRLVAGNVASVYEQTSAAVKAAISLAEVEQLFDEARAVAPIGARVEERVIPVGSAKGVYFADHAHGEGRLRFRIVIDPSGLMPSVEPVRPLPADPRGNEPARARPRLPFDGLWWAGVAPTPEIGNHHAAARDQRHAFDFVIWRDGSTHRRDGHDNADYWAWAKPVRAPAAGTVVAAHDGIADNRPGAETNTAKLAGNHVVIDLGHGEYAALAHFQKGSIRVAKGDRVSSGQVLGLVGNSGNSSEPHIHFHVQDGPRFDPGGSVGIPVHFETYEADGITRPRGTPSAGQFVRPLQAGTR